MTKITQDKLTLFKKKIASLSENEMQNVLGGLQQLATIQGTIRSTQQEMTCTWCSPNHSDVGKCAEADQ